MKISFRQFRERIHGPVETGAAIATILTALIGGVAWIAHANRSSAARSPKASTSTTPRQSGAIGETGTTSTSAPPSTSTTRAAATTTRAAATTTNAVTTATAPAQPLTVATCNAPEPEILQWFLRKVPDDAYRKAYGSSMVFNPKTGTEWGSVDFWFKVSIPTGRTLELRGPRMTYKSAHFGTPITLPNVNVSFWTTRDSTTSLGPVFEKVDVPVGNSTATTLDMTSVAADVPSGAFMRLRILNDSSGIPPDAAISVASYGDGFCLYGALGRLG